MLATVPVPEGAGASFYEVKAGMNLYAVHIIGFSRLKHDLQHSFYSA